MDFDQRMPLTFELPDGDVASVITWEYVIYQLEQQLGKSLDHMESINSNLEVIDNKLTQWLPEEEKED